MVSRFEYLGEDGWEHGFDVCVGQESAVLDTNPNGFEEMLYIKCEPDNSATLIFRLTEGEFSWVTPTTFRLEEDKLPEAVLREDSQPFESTIFEEENLHRRNIQITHIATH